MKLVEHPANRFRQPQVHRAPGRYEWELEVFGKRRRVEVWCGRAIGRCRACPRGYQAWFYNLLAKAPPDTRGAVKHSERGDPCRAVGTT